MVKLLFCKKIILAHYIYNRNEIIIMLFIFVLIKPIEIL
ncbi:putative membrane protein [Serratia plymuthica A30]|nr:putative membrane protein [Serratia plymuthica A30]